MTINDFLSSIKQNGANFSPPSNDRAITLATTALQHMRAAVLPAFMIDLYKTVGGINLGDAYIFGATETITANNITIPSIVEINRDVAHINELRGITIFGRNDLFWFAFDAFGRCQMLDNINLSIMRKYDDPVRALTDCIIIGKL
jgi:hypothetical protein